MTTLPPRSNLAGIGSTYGQVRSALGDLRDFLEESLGTSGTSPVIDGATLTNTESIAVGLDAPGATVQIKGSLSITTAAAASSDPGDGNVHLDGLIKFTSSLGAKVEIAAASGNPMILGSQTNSMYMRVKTGGLFSVYEGGVHSDTPGTAGSGGVTLLSVGDSSFTYKGQTIYHSGNGVFIRKDAEDTAAEKITFAKGWDSQQNVKVGFSGSAAQINFDGTTNGNRMNLSETAGAEALVLGVQASTIFARTQENFTIYKGGTWASTAKTPGTGGSQLFHVSSTEFKYKNFDIYHAGNSTFVTQKSATRPGVTELWRSDADVAEYLFAHWNHLGDSRFRIRASNGQGVRVDHASTSDASFASSYRAGTDRPLLFETSNQRKGVTRFYRNDADQAIFIDTAFDGTRFLLRAINEATGTHNWEVRVQRADAANYADTAGSVNSVNGHTIQDGTVRVYELALATGSLSAGNTQFAPLGAVHQFAFGSVNASGFTTGTIGYTGNGRILKVQGNVASSGGTTSVANSGGGTVTWDYVTGSGDPRVWVTVDDKGYITNTWDAEDPFDREFPNENPIYLLNDKGEAVKDPSAILVEIPSVEVFNEGCKRLVNKPLPGWVKKSIFNGDTPDVVINNILTDYTKKRVGMQEFTLCKDWLEFVNDLDDNPKKQEWRRQAILRAYSRLFGDSPIIETGTILQVMFKVDKKTRKLELR